MLGHTIITNKNSNNNVNDNIVIFIISYLYIIFIQMTFQILFHFELTKTLKMMFT